MNATATIIPRELLAPFCLRHGIRRVALFGSMLTGRARPDSDIDLLVEFETGRSPADRDRGAGSGVVRLDRRPAR